MTLTLLGDSITSGYGLPPSQRLPRQLQSELHRRDLSWRVHGAGAAGDTTGDALRRLNRSIAPGTSLCIVAVGANDVLTGVAPAQFSADLTALVGTLRSRGIIVILAGLHLPPYLGAGYAEAFNSTFIRLGRRAGVTLIPNWLAGVLGDPALNQADCIHPNGAGVRIIARRLADAVAIAAPR
ncbi:GDSL-type esterase/lipase family protein [Caulobacter segnis]|uniref:GDSL-type esterase/lipase family protein n=1 Tax=Caulobacter segnis TaxID=88688 RepID=UPI00240F56FA|nr:GDSL-type esterase/lipase family protein [Caulobacter segnis]MDG2521302.1 GDSL-type esterase/lipase family protein [Caulobacter segnis]